MRPEWNNFVAGKWENEVNVRDFIQKNYHPYDGDESFLAEATQDTKDLWQMVLELQKRNVKQAAFSIWIPRLYLLSYPMAPVILTNPRKKSLDSRQISPSSVLFSLTAVSEWQKKLVLTTDMK